MAEERVLIGLVTVTFNSAKVIDEFMASVLAQDDCAFILYIVDNASSDGTLERLSEYHDDRIRLIKNANNVGVAEGNNRGIVAALVDGCSSVLLINNDVVFGPSLIRQLVEAAQRPDVSMVVPKIYFFQPSNRIWCAGGRFVWFRGQTAVHFGEGEEDLGQFDRPRTVDYTPTCCMLVKRSVFEQIGYMDERYFVYSDDADFCLRARAHGLNLLYFPEAKLWHKVSALTGGQRSAFAMRYGTRNRVYFMRKHLTHLESMAFLPLYLVHICGDSLIRRDYKALSVRWKAYWEGMRMEVAV